MSLDEFIVELSSSVEFKTRLDDLLSESFDFCLQPRTLSFSIGDSLLHIAFFRLRRNSHYVNTCHHSCNSVVGDLNFVW